MGDTEIAWSNCAHIFEGKAESGGQEHLYIETQGAYAVPGENGFIKVYSSTQGPTAVQKTVSRVLGKPMHQVEVDTTRLGGGFGGKEDQASTWGAICAIAAHITKNPVKYSLDRMEDMRMTGKRHPYSSDYKIGLDKDLNIIAYEAQYYQNGGAAADLSPAILERTLFHATNTYNIPNVKTSAYPCKTNLPPNTAFRGFGGPQGMFVIETAIVHAAEALGIEPHVIQHKNLLKTGDEFPYGQKVVSEAIECWTEAETQFINSESWLNNRMHPRHKAMRHQQFNDYVFNEVVPFIRNMTSQGTEIITCGASFGALHSANLFFRRPDLINGVIAMSGNYNLSTYTDGYHDEDVYFNSPMEYLPGLNDDFILPRIKPSKHIHILTGSGDWETPDPSRRFSAMLNAKEIPHELDVWGPDMPHDWSTWRAMLPYYLETRL